VTVEKIISFMRTAMNIQDPEGTSSDTAYISMTDEEIESYLTVALSRDFPNVPSLDVLPNDALYPLTLLARKDLYFTLATIDAPLFDIGADNNNYLKRSQRFSHYMELIQQLDQEYQDYLDDGGAGGNTLTSYNAVLSRRHFTEYAYNNMEPPAPSLKVDSVGIDYADISWLPLVENFYMYRVYISDSTIVDPYVIGNHIMGGAKLVASIKDPHQSLCRVEGLLPNTTYHVAVSSIARNTLTGYSESTFTTLSEPDVDTGGED
jgi:hypothetical protein